LIPTLVTDATFKIWWEQLEYCKGKNTAANNHYAKFGTATTNIFRVDGPALVKRGMKKEINYPTELELPEKVVTERPNKRYY
jgi:hypothetical protein